GAIHAVVRAWDVPERYSGDEFVVLLPEKPAKGGVDVAERIRAAVAAGPLPLGDKPVRLSVSIGVAAFPEDGRALDSLAARADRALYEAKRRGRNCVVRYSPG